MMDHATKPAIDIHAHAVPAGVIGRVRAEPSLFQGVRVLAEPGGPRFVFAGTSPTRPVRADLHDAASRIAWMTENGIGTQVISAWLDVMGYQLPGREGADWSAFLTEELVHHAAAIPGTVALGSVPLQDPHEAATGLRHAVEIGCPGVMIGTRTEDSELDDDAYHDLWAAADDTAAVVYLHPGFGGDNPRYRDFGLLNGLGRLEDTTVAVARLLYAGIPAKYPRMKMVLAHAGGALPYVIGRLVQNYVSGGRRFADPLESFQHLYFDSVVFDAESLELLARRTDPDRVMLGSDYPFPIGDLRPRGVVERSSLSDTLREKILHRNAAAAFGIAPATVEP